MYCSTAKMCQQVNDTVVPFSAVAFVCYDVAFIVIPAYYFTFTVNEISPCVFQLDNIDLFEIQDI